MNITSSSINLEYLRLMADNDEELVQTMLVMLLEELPDEFEKIKMLHQSGDWEELGQVSHKMKSTLAFVGNKEMINANKEIEYLAKNNLDVHRINRLIATLEQYFPIVVQELKQACQSC